MGITDARSIDPDTDPDESVTQASRRAAAEPWLVPNRGVLAIAWLLLAGCTVGPKYVRPTTDVPSDYKEAASEFKQAEPRDQIAKGKWWEIYDDPRLNSLEERISVSNQTLKAQQAQFVEARAALRVARAQLYPTVSASLSASRTGQSQNRALFSNPARQVYNDFSLPFDVSYEPDVWGRVRRLVEASRAQAQASAADLASVDLTLHAELATDYFELRGLDSEKQLLDSTVEAYERALQLTQSRYQGGVASAVDVAQAQTQLETTRALAKDVEVNRARFEHAIAVLAGETPATFSIEPMSLTTPPPPTPPGLPSDLLERRPDIAGAERRVELANAQIGVARAAYFPLFTLTGVGGFESSALGTLIQGPSGLWALGGSAAQFIFDGGQRRGVSEQARAAFDQSVASYRQTVLTGFLEVEDNLAALRILQEEAQTQAGAVAAAEHSLELSNNRYRGGVANYLEVTTAQSAALSDEVTAVNLLTRRMTSSVLLIKALGGGWSVSQIPPI
jgi:NodT family efflux transporter outer membrane factor (OMF) lipoprotein